MTIESLNPWAIAVGGVIYIIGAYVVWPRVQARWTKPAVPKSDEQPPQAVADWIARTQEQFPTAKPDVVLGWLKGRKTTFEMALDYAGVATSLPVKGEVK